jgi:hypothetical protein
MSLTMILLGPVAGIAAQPPAGLAAGGLGALPPALGLCAPTDEPPASIKARPGYEQFQVSASDPAGKPIVHLKEADFVFPAYLHPQVVYFHEDAAGPPASIVILIDASGSMKTKLPEVQNAHRIC